ncbi:MAG: Hsp20/alpha crystallin family protein [Bacteroidetes bacterium]|nr:Hsp20/alpha crystallin family protein [Bacteroidota bacterium]MBK8343882.1 Hsp20/alpha crystallin family protein [Bacteroidota bacterium]
MTLVKKGWSSPFANGYLSDLFNTDKFFNDEFINLERMPAVNVIDNEKFYELEVAVPGMHKEDFKVEIKDGLLSIYGERKDEKKEEDKNYTRKEFSCLSFSRMFTLPENVRAGEIDAEYKNGVLNIVLPKKEVTTVAAKKVEVK